MLFQLLVLLVIVLLTGYLATQGGLTAILSFIAARRGYGKEMLTYRGVTLVLIIGVIIGFVIGKVT